NLSEMKSRQSLIISLFLMVLVSALYRIMPSRPMGFAPQIAMGLFSGALFVRQKQWAFALPLVSMFLSDLLYQWLYIEGLTPIAGFYGGQWVNYLLFAGTVCFGFLIRSSKISRIILAAVSAPTAYFLVSNFLVWQASGLGYGLNRPHTFLGLLQCYNDALPFYLNSLSATSVFSAVLFGSYYLTVHRRTAQVKL
ncbi:MAG TPA: DUF6580 family putative transport protein, partial [Sediminibacterium sp.]|nr:DUF6580 family putative transport protein [Sediminibacterium sp.]